MQDAPLIVIAIIAGVATLAAYAAWKRDAWIPKALFRLKREDRQDGIDEDWEQHEFGDEGRQ
jgi:hypothetical protein